MATEAKGKFKPEVIEAHIAAEGGKPLKGNKKILYDSEEIEYTLPREKSERGKFGTCLYMDVGLWAGDGPENSPTHYPRRRDFGVISGNLAVLCSYQGRKELVQWPPGKSNDFAFCKRVGHFLNHMSGDPNLGCVKVSKAMFCDDLGIVKERLAGCTKDGLLNKDKHKIIYVFLGDLHAPVITEFKRTFLLRNEAEEIMENLTPDAFLGKTHSCGRLPISGENYVKMAEYAEKIGSVLKNVAGPVDSLLYTLLIKYCEIFAGKPQITGFSLPGEEPIIDSMESREAQLWYRYYNGSASGLATKECKCRGADIFEGAGKDLKKWIKLLETYKPEEKGVELIFVQLGDMYDFWLGFKCGFGEVNRSGAISFVPYAGKFAKFWSEETKRTTGCFHSMQAEAINSLENIKSSYLQKAFFLYGNHDNYFQDLGKQGIFEPEDKNDPVIAEHGHASDTFNSDDDPRRGWSFTQLAFFMPEIRALEGPVSSFRTKVLRALIKMSRSLHPAVELYLRYFEPDKKVLLGDRLERIARGADLCVEKNCLIYVMGHTHHAMLKKIRIFRK